MSTPNPDLRNPAVLQNLCERIVRINQGLTVLQTAAFQLEKILQVSLGMQRDVTYLQQVCEYLQQNGVAVSEVPTEPAAGQLPRAPEGVQVVGMEGAAALEERYAGSLTLVRNATDAGQVLPTEEPALPPVRFDEPTNAVEAVLNAIAPGFSESPVASPARHPASAALGELAQVAGALSTNLRGALEKVRDARDAAAPGQPAAEGPAEEEPDNRPYLGHFFGPHSVFMHMLSPEMHPGGRGFAKPGYGGLKQYSADITRTALSTLETWPSGFYRGSKGERQLYLNLPEGRVLVQNVSDLGALPVLAHSTGFVPVSALRVAQLKALHDGIGSYFRGLEKQAA